ncbi:MAG: hypothetical protein HY659_02510 [Rhizobiales bacterium]|nr:hypothetical protein [Hyphomicrobiales bacterium]
MASAVVLAAAFGLSACSSSSVIDNIPASVGGLPSGTPERPAEPLAYPAVHDIPPPRAAAVLSDDERNRLEAELAAARLRQETSTGTLPKDKSKKPKQNAQ